MPSFPSLLPSCGPTSGAPVSAHACILVPLRVPSLATSMLYALIPTQVILPQGYNATCLPVSAYDYE
eukprot:2651902-Rhodomonas_salina.1